MIQTFCSRFYAATVRSHITTYHLSVSHTPPSEVPTAGMLRFWQLSASEAGMSIIASSRLAVKRVFRQFVEVLPSLTT